MFKFSQYVEGFLKTKQLNGLIRNIDDFDLPLKSPFSEKLFPKINRLGKIVEFIFEEIIKQDSFFNLICSNVQLFQGKKTIGEVDYIFEWKDILFHLEVSYKFYLYDESNSDLFRNRWIGPNRKDSLALKLLKLELNQFPLRHSEEFKKLLKKFSLSKPLHQSVLLKAQLFIPFKTSIRLPYNFKKCIEGSWLSMKNIHLLSDSAKFFIPKKSDWIINPKDNKEWYSKKMLLLKIIEYHERKYSPLIWMTTKKNVIVKLFIVWW